MDLCERSISNLKRKLLGSLTSPELVLEPQMEGMSAISSHHNVFRLVCIVKRRSLLAKKTVVFLTFIHILPLKHAVPESVTATRHYKMKDALISRLSMHTKLLPVSMIKD